MDRNAREVLEFSEGYEYLRRDNLFRDILFKLSHSTNLKEVLCTVIPLIKEISGCEAVGIRLAENEDYPYFVCDGFSELFIRRENFLCHKDEAGKRIGEVNGKGYLLECMCGNVLRGRTNPALDFFSQKGSFYCNETGKLLPALMQHGGGENVRNFCNSCGYESVALVPIKIFEDTIGLIQINDKRKNCFDLKLIELLEILGSQIGLAVKNAWNTTQFTESQALIRLIEKSEHLKSEFIANISHELRTPIHIILASISLMKMHLTKANPIDYTSSSWKHLHTTKQNCYRLLRLINNLIDMSRIEVGQYKLEIGTHNLAKMTERVVDSLKIYFEEQGRRLVFIKNTEDARVSCDLDALERVLLNLMSNALKYSHKDSQVVVEIGKTKSSFMLSVKDDGLGIPEDKLSLIFERFKQVDNQLTRASQGSGIGLSLVKSLVLLHKGDVKVESTLGLGSTFSIELPLASETCFKEKPYLEKCTENFQDSRVERMRIEFSDIYQGSSSMV